MPDVQCALSKARELLESTDLDAQADSEWLMCAALGCARSALRFGRLDDETEARYFAMVRRRASGEPLQYIIGDQPFLGYSIRTDSRALIPRPETEELCLRALDALKAFAAPRVLDIGTGTGAIAIALKLKRPDARVTAVDISADALSLADENAKALGADIELAHSDLFSALEGREFDMIISNPPYLTADDMRALQPEVRREPALALYGGVDGLDFYRRIAAEAPQHMVSGGVCALEIGAGQAAQIKSLFIERFDVTIYKDMEGVERMLFGALK